jgi:hypothetical protein
MTRETLALVAILAKPQCCELDTFKFVRIAVDWLLRSDIGEVTPIIKFPKNPPVEKSANDQDRDSPAEPSCRLHIYEVPPRKVKRGVDLISDVLQFGRLWYDTPDHAIGYTLHYSRSADAVIRVYDAAL